MLGSVLGFLFELFYRRILFGKWIKPGVFYGVYLPLYGIGLCICYFVYNLNVYFICKIVLATLLLSFIELICGIIFIKYFKLPLWDYSRNKFNYKGLVCLKYSLCWTLLGFLCLKFIFPYINIDVFCVREVILLMYLFYVILICDVLYKLFYLFYSKKLNKVR